MTQNLRERLREYLEHTKSCLNIGCNKCDGVDGPLAASKLMEAIETIDGLLRTVSIDWYVQQFGRTETKGESSAVAAIHNHELRQRISEKLERARAFLASLDAEGEG